MGTHANDLLYGTVPPESIGSDGLPMGDDMTDNVVSDLGQGSGNEHIVFRRDDASETGRLGLAFDEVGNQIPREEDEDGPVPII
jgi:hypothetical protein